MVQIEQRLAVLDTGIVDQDVDRPDLSLALGNGAGDLCRVGDVKGAGLSGDPIIGKAGGHGLCLIRVASIDNDLSPGRTQAAREGQPNPSTRASDESGAPCQVKEGCAHLGHRSGFKGPSARSPDGVSASHRM